MRFATPMVGVLAVLLMASACATTPLTDPGKYNFDDQLERITMIDKFPMIGWSRIDMQSFVLQAGPSVYYLVVLNVPNYELPTAETVWIDARGSKVRAGNSSVIVYGEYRKDSSTIDKLYKFKDAGEIQPIIDQIRK